MSKFDRCIFISIAIGIWALAMVQLFKPEQIQAGFTNRVMEVPLSYTVGKCPFVAHVETDMSGKHKIVDYCNYLLVASYDDLIKHDIYFQ